MWDLYCGIGTISLFLARNAGRVCGVEIIPQAIGDAKQNAALNGIENAEFFVGKAEEVLPQKYRDEQIKADVIVVDPPRKGCDEAARDDGADAAGRIVYVSCDSATLAQDLKYLCGNGYELVRSGELISFVRPFMWKPPCFSCGNLDFREGLRDYLKEMELCFYEI